MSKKILMYVVTLTFLGVMGFALGAQAGPGEALIPGSGEDPLASRSYVQEALGSKVAELEAQVTDLKARVQVLQEKLK